MTGISQETALPSAVMLDGWEIINTDLAGAVDHLAGLANAETPSLVVTPNLQHLRLLRRDEAFRGAYNTAEARYADGMPLVWASKMRGTPLAERVAGSDLEPALCERLAELGGHAVYIGGDTQDINNRATANRRAQFPGLHTSGLSPSMRFGKSPAETADILRFVNETAAAAGPLAVFVCAGSPKSEVWAAQNLANLPRGVVLPVGAAIDFAAGVKERATAGMQSRGLEWLHRLVSEPRRLGPRYAKDALFLGGLMGRSLLHR